MRCMPGTSCTAWSRSVKVHARLPLPATLAGFHPGILLARVQKWCYITHEKEVTTDEHCTLFSETLLTEQTGGGQQVAEGSTIVSSPWQVTSIRVHVLP